MYRTASPPAPSPEVVTLPPHRGRRVFLGFGLWFLAIWFVLFGVAWVLDAAITGQEVWRVAPAVLILGVTVWVIAKTLRLETIYVGNLEIRRVGVLREHRIKWADVTGSHWITRRRRGARPPVRLLMIDGAAGQELLVAPNQVGDPTGVLAWAIAEATAGRPEAIDERIRHEGKRPRKNRVFAVHGAIGLALFVVMGGLLFPFRLEHHAERELRGIEQLPFEERIAQASRISESSWQNDRTRCRASSTVVYSRLSLGETQAAEERCTEMLRAGCTNAPYDDCEMLRALVRAESALDGGRSTEAATELEALESCLFRVCVNVRIRILRATGDDERARQAAAECRERFDDDVATSDLLAPCRE
ncbi:MAG: hypothetical protein JRH11_06570 [Deltaproteobacteria bacterium]|nr:hypothetical protein [Deltaproteobacteria bacterium]